MTTDEAALLAAIIAAPEEDTPRLAYADWLQERAGAGDAERAELIRAQIERARAPECGHTDPQPAGCRSCQLGVRAQDLLFDHEPGWLHDLCPELADESGTGRPGLHPRNWSRGFLAAATCAAAGWVARGDAVRARHPVTRVRLTTWPELHAAWDRGAARARLRDHGSAARVVVESPPDDWTRAEREQVVLELLALVWPGVTFELPD